MGKLQGSDISPRRLPAGCLCALPRCRAELSRAPRYWVCSVVLGV
jgi:hypothetical protein